MAKTASKKSQINPLLLRLGNGSNNANKKPRTPKDISTNPLLKRLGHNNTRPATNKVTKAPTHSKATKTQKDKRNPLLAALEGDKSDVNTLEKRLLRDKSVTKSKDKIAPALTLVPTGPKATREKDSDKATAKKLRPEQTPQSSYKKYLKITNLENGISAQEISTVLHDIGPLTSVNVRDLPSGSARAEVQFAKMEHLEKACARLNGVVADGRVIQATIVSGDATGLQISLKRK